MSELRPCPFCGKQPTVGLNGYPRCPIPGIGTHAGGMTVDEWNTRPLEDALQKRVGELEKSIGKAVEEIEEEDIYGQLTWNAIKPILRNHGLIGGNK